MGLLDTFTADTDEGRQLRGGLLNMGIGLLQGSTGHYGQFAPALAQGFAGWQQWQQQVANDIFKRQQAQQTQALQDMRMKSLMREERDYDDAQRAISGGISPQDALRHANPEVRKWGESMLDIDYRNRALEARNAPQLGSRSGLVPTTQGYAYLDEYGKPQFMTGSDGKPLMPVSAANADPNVAYGKAYGSAKGKAQAEFEEGAKGNLANVDLMLGTIDKALEHKGLGRSVGLWSKMPDMPGSDAADFKAIHNQIAGQVFLDAFGRLKGAGAITEAEGQQAKNAAARLDLAQSEDAYRAALKELRGVVDRGRTRLISRSAIVPQATAQPQQQAPEDFSSLWE